MVAQHRRRGRGGASRFAAAAALAAVASAGAGIARAEDAPQDAVTADFGPLPPRDRVVCNAPPTAEGFTLAEVAHRGCTVVFGNVTSAGAGKKDEGFIDASKLRSIVAPNRAPCGTYANLEISTTNVTGIDLSGLRAVEGKVEIEGRHDGSSALEHLDLRSLRAVFGYNCPADAPDWWLGSTSGGGVSMGADDVEAIPTPVTSLPDAFAPDADSTDDFLAAWREALGNITAEAIDYRGAAVVDPDTFGKAPYRLKAPGGLRIAKHPLLGPVVDMGKLLFVNGDLEVVRTDALEAVDLSSLRAVNGDILFETNRALASLATLSNVLVVTDDIIVRDNARLAALDLREMLFLLGRLSVEHNPHLVYAGAESLLAAHPPAVVCGLCWLAGAQTCYDDSEHGSCTREGFDPEYADLCHWATDLGCGACFEHSSCSYRDEDMELPTIEIKENDQLATVVLRDVVSVGGSIDVSANPALLALNFDALWRAWGNIVITYNDALRFIFAPRLEVIYGGLMVSKNYQLVMSVMSHLEEIFDYEYYYTTPAFVTVTDNYRMELLDLTALRNVTGHVDIVGNKNLPIVELQCLEEVASLDCADIAQCECNNFDNAVSSQCLPPTQPCGAGIGSDDVFCYYEKLREACDDSDDCEPEYTLHEVAEAGCKVAYDIESKAEDDVGSIHLPHLQATVEDFHVIGSYNLVEFTARDLVYVGDDLRLWNCDDEEFVTEHAPCDNPDMLLASFDLSGLRAVRDNLYIEDLRLLGPVLDLSALVVVGGEKAGIDQLSGEDRERQQAFIEEIDLSALKAVLGELELEWLPMLKRVHLGSLVTAGSVEVDDNEALEYLALPELVVVGGGEYNVQFGPDTVDRELEVDDNMALMYFGAPKLVFVQGETEVEDNDALRTIQLGSLVLTSKIDIEDNPELTTVNLGALKHVYPVGVDPPSSSVSFENDYRLTDLDLSSLISTAGDLSIVNTVLPCLYLPALEHVHYLPRPVWEGRCVCSENGEGFVVRNATMLYTIVTPKLEAVGPTHRDCSGVSPCHSSCGRHEFNLNRCDAGVFVVTEEHALDAVNLQSLVELATPDALVLFEDNSALFEVDMPCLEREGATVECGGPPGKGPVDPTECFCKPAGCERKSYISCGEPVGPTHCPALPTASPTKAPTLPPKDRPTKSPTKSPTAADEPTPKPTPMPTKQPTKAPVQPPPTKAPTKRPTYKPTESPTSTHSPTKSPTKSPTTSSPTPRPTLTPTTAPTKSPTNKPTPRPTPTPTRLERGQCCERDQPDWKVSGDMCGASKLKKGNRCFKSKGWAAAEQICADEGAELCSADALVSAAIGTGCGLDKKFVWTNETCGKAGKAGANKFIARRGDGGPSVCAAAGRKFGVRCCMPTCEGDEGGKTTPADGDDGVDGSSPAGVCCQQQDDQKAWRFDDVAKLCAASKPDGECFKGSFEEAQAFCGDAGARLPTLDEHPITSRTGCGYDKAYAWTDLSCGKGRHYVRKGNKRICALDTKNFATRCVAQYCE